MIRRSMGVGGIPAYAGMTLEGAGMTLEGGGMTLEGAGTAVGVDSRLRGNDV